MSADLIHTLELAGGCIAFGLLVIRFSRRRKISFRYTTGWLLICALGVFASLLLPAPWAGSVNSDRARSPVRNAMR